MTVDYLPDLEFGFGVDACFNGEVSFDNERIIADVSIYAERQVTTSYFYPPDEIRTYTIAANNAIEYYGDGEERPYFELEKLEKTLSQELST